jgi:SAM-dependent methyltransferase
MSQYSDSKFTKDDNSSWYKIFKMINPGSKVLDVGCSSGNFGEVLIREKGCVVHGIEIDSQDRAEANKKLNKVFGYNVETDDLSGLDRDYDFIYFGDVIEHLHWPSPTLKKIGGYLKQDGGLLFSVPNMTHLLVRLKLLEGKFEHGETGLLDKTHLHYYDYDFLQSTLNTASYELALFDPVLKDIPKEIIEEELAKVGLKATKKFLDFTRSTQASIYQFVGQARKVETDKLPKILPLQFSSPADIFQDYLDRTTKHYQQTIVNYKKNQRSLKRENDALRSQLKAITESTTWKAVDKARKLKRIGRRES